MLMEDCTVLPVDVLVIKTAVSLLRLVQRGALQHCTGEGVKEVKGVKGIP